MARQPLSQDLGLGGFDANGDCTMKVLRSELGADRPKLGEALTFQGATYRITRVTDHPQFPMIVLVVEPEEYTPCSTTCLLPTAEILDGSSDVGQGRLAKGLDFDAFPRSQLSDGAVPSHDHLIARRGSRVANGVDKPFYVGSHICVAHKERPPTITIGRIDLARRVL